NGNTATIVFYKNRLVFVTHYLDFAAKAFSCYVNGVGKDFEDSMFTAYQPVRPENNRGTQTDTVSTFQRGNTLIIIVRILIRLHRFTCFYIIIGKNPIFICSSSLLYRNSRGVSRGEGERMFDLEGKECRFVEKRLQF